METVPSRSGTATARSPTSPPRPAIPATASSRCTSGCWEPASSGRPGWRARTPTAPTSSRPTKSWRKGRYMADLEIRELHVSVDNREILKGITLGISKGEVHAVMGPNGSGKSTLSNTLMGHPGYKIEGGQVLFKGRNIAELTPDERSRLGMFLALQYPIVVPGITMNNFLRTALNAHRGYDGKDKSKAVSPKEFRSLVEPYLDTLKIEKGFLSRYINEGFSGGEKKRVEILQMAVLKPEIAILDETDSGLDIDSIKYVSEAIQ